MATKPKVIVFDLDYTLWPFWVDTHVTPPFRKGSDGNVLDAHNCKVKFYPDVPQVLKSLTDQGYKLAIASRTSEIEGAMALMDLFNWKNYFSYVQIFPGCKVTHFVNIKKESGLDYQDMIFFDDENRNIKDVEKLGVTSILVKSGVTEELVNLAFKEYTSRRS